MDAAEILKIFFAECEEALGTAEAGLAACRSGDEDDENINAVFRAVHSIKGGAGAFGFLPLQAYTHNLETLLSDARDALIPIDEPLVDLLLRALDVLSDHVAAASEDASPPDDTRLIEQLAAARAEAGDTHENVSAETAAAPEPEVARPEPASESEAEGEAALDDMLNDIFGSIEFERAPAKSDAAPEITSWPFQVRMLSGAMRNGSEPLLLLRALETLGAACVGCDVSRVPQLDALNPGEAYLDWTFAVSSAVSEASACEIFDFIGKDCVIAVGPAQLPAVEKQADAPKPAIAPAPAPGPAPVAAASPANDTPKREAAPPTPKAAGSEGGSANSAPQSIRIELTKLDRLIDAVGELVIAQAMMAQRLLGSGVSANEELSLLETLTRDIQESAMAIRAQPVSTVFTRVPRILRELAGSTGKHVRLEVIGESTELDKTVIERLGEPLTHLIRNAVDHGIESAAARVAAGKDPEGLITLSAEQRSGRILIRVCDDGGGIDRVRVLAKAIEKGLVAPEAQMTGEEIDNLIFAAGFSTAATVTNVSGRGVGMDVVRQNVKDLGGRITIESQLGKGTAFTLTLPLTLAISDGMIVSAGGETLVVPLTHVVECLCPGTNDLQPIGHRMMLNLRGRVIPVLSLRSILSGDSGVSQDKGSVLIVVDTEAAGQAALMVDEITDQRQFVIKSLDTNYQAVRGVAGATILGDGKVALIIDVDGVVADVLEQRGLAA